MSIHASDLSLTDRLMFLREVPIFRGIDDYDFLRDLAVEMVELRFQAGETIFERGDVGQLLYILSEGQVKIHIGDVELARLEAGAYFGEMSLFDSEPRSASVTALTPCTCLCLSHSQMQEAILNNPAIALNIIQNLCQRIRRLNQLVSVGTYAG
ncbi:MAG: cyclic nucleotide-binding domain-containing protein [Gloeomargarita sp. SKYBB_i_bin120]|nr:cyclic nucleotide-binding domain-containing protein [Gloeomargarita sp. SKYG98]MCS7292850.1 cyclic nucleotide-binding domain-containing protein [Gloeomargarita sp. SKYB120]MDW8178413.1 cyclic nucleotide-binding domain-containing protein [Gloeomargarita sp. SKYBB_i_bin120]